MGRLKSVFIRLVDNLYNKFHTEEPSLSVQLIGIMKNFDFDRVATFMNWDKSSREYNEDDICIKEGPWLVFNHKSLEHSVPTVSELKASAYLLLEQVIKLYEPNNPDKQVVWIGTGPFKVVCRYGILELMCVIEYWSYD